MSAPQSINPSTGAVADVLTHASGLMRKEVELARAEVRENLTSAALGIGMIVGAVVIALTALNVLSAALVVAVTDLGVDAGWAALLVGLGFAIIAGALMHRGVAALKPQALAPTQTTKNVRADLRTVKEQFNDG
ncbi:MAG: phage holin family protein [Pseudomonadota bacterium]